MAGEPEGAELQYMVGIPVSFQVNNHSVAFIKASWVPQSNCNSSWPLA